MAEKEKKKAVVITAKHKEPKATVVGIVGEASPPKASIVRVGGEITPVLPIDPNEFSKYCRKLLGLKPTDPFSNFHLQKLAKDFGLTPVAFVNTGNSWTLATDYDYPSGKLGLYVPSQGLKEIPYGSAQRVWYFQAPSILRLEAANLSIDKYQLPREPLQRLGPIQGNQNPYDCGPLSVYAAKVAKGI